VPGCFLPILVIALVAVAMLPAPALAHMVSADVGDFYAGLLHPLSSVEHVSAVLAAAFLAAQCGARAGRLAVIIVPTALVVGILAGVGWPLPWVAALANAGALAIVGGLIIAAPRVAPALAAACAAAVGLTLGWRSGGDWAASQAGWQFVPGAAAAAFAATALVAAWIPRLAGGWRGAGRMLVGAAFAGYGSLLLAQGLGGAGGGLRLPGLPDGAALREFLQHPVRSPAALAGALALAMAWGAAHALTPGHGKTLVGAYLVGSRGTWRQAVWLGLTVTVAHTLGVFALGMVAVLAAGRVAQERLVPWLTLASGLGMLGVGGALALRDLFPGRIGHEHSHGATAHRHGGIAHSHGGSGHSHGGPGLSHGDPGRSHDETVAGELGWRSLLALGVSGGLAPCPSALALMLGAIALGRVELGLALVAAFGLGLAGVLTAVGLLCLKGARVLEGAGGLGRVARWLPLLGAGLIAAIGGLVVLEALAGLGLW